MLGGFTDWVFGRMGYVVMRKSFWDGERGVLGWENLGGAGFTPRTVIDVGVGRGTYPLYEAFPHAYLLLVEPLQESDPYIARILERFKGEARKVAVGERDEERIINVEPRRRLRSSMLERTASTKTGDQPEQRRIQVTTLDAVMEASGLAGPYGLKIDVEGFELPVLRGATRTLAQTEFVIAETSVARRFLGGSTFAGVVGFMDQQGFGVRDLVQIARTPDHRSIAHTDLLFTRDPPE